MKKNKNRLWKTTGNILFLVMLVIVVSSYLYQSFQIDLIMKEMHSLHLKKKQLLSETERLQAEVNRLSNIDRVAKIATEKFDLHFTNESMRIIRIEDPQHLSTIKEKFAQQEVKENKVKTAGIH